MLSSPFKYLNRKSISYLSRPFKHLKKNHDAHACKHPPEFTIIIVNQHPPDFSEGYSYGRSKF